MSKLRLSILAFLIFVLGAFAGGGAMMWGFNEFIFHQQQISQTSADALIRVTALRALQEHKTNEAISLLEAMLDGDMISLSVIPQERLDSQTISVVQRTSDYREKYPHISNFPEVDSQISAFLERHRSSPSKQIN